MSVLISNTQEKLKKDWIPDTIINRYDKKKKIKTSVFEPLKKKEYPDSLYIYGSSGTGKTALVRSLLESTKEDIEKHCPNYEPIIFNANNFPSNYMSMLKVAKSLERYLPIKLNGSKISRIPERGWNWSKIVEVITKIIEEKKISTCIVIDEIDVVVNKENNDQLIYTLVEKSSYIENGELSLLAVSNDPKLEKEFDKTKDRLRGKKVHFPKYNPQQLYEILEFFSRECLEEDSWKEEDLRKISKSVGNTSGSARAGKRVLYKLGRKSNGNLDINLLGEAMDEVERDMIEEELLSRPLHHQIVLLAIVNAWDRYSKIASRNKKSDLRKFTYIPTTKNIYSQYKKLCSKIDAVDRKSLSSVKKYIDSLEEDNIVDKTIKGFGRARGVSSIVELNHPKDLVEGMIKPRLLN